VEEFREEKGIESSNKATEEVAAVAIDTRKRLAERAARARALREREQAFQDELAAHAEAEPALIELITAAQAARGDGSSISQAQFGRLQALTRLALQSLGAQVFAGDAETQAMLTVNTDTLFQGREFDPLAVRAVGGGYEDPGDIARLGTRVVEDWRDERYDETERDRRLALVADVAELFDCCKAIDLTIGFSTVAAEPQAIWRALADFFAESLNDHFYSYRPWVYSRGIGFSHIRDSELYTLAVEHYQWLYRYQRAGDVRATHRVHEDHVDSRIRGNDRRVEGGEDLRE
jgi:hypothetical protein